MTAEQIILTLLVPCIMALASVVALLWKNQRSSTEDIIQHLKEEVQQLQVQVAELKSTEKSLQEQVNQLQQERAQLQTQFLLLQTSHESSPLPMWIKDQSGRVLAANEAYEKYYLRPIGKTLEDWIGNYDRDVFPQDVAEDWGKNDLWVFQNELTFDGEELVDIGGGRRARHRIIKHPRYARGISRPFGIAGIAIPDSLT